MGITPDGHNNLNMNYFLDHTYQPNDNCTEQIQQFNQLKQTLSKISGLMADIPVAERLHKEEALAFLIEATKQLSVAEEQKHPQKDKENKNLYDFQTTMQALKTRITNIQNDKDQQQAAVEISWMINQLVDNLYQKTLARHAVDGVLHKKNEYASCLRVTHTLDAFQRRLHESKKAVGFGAIIDDFVPNWYKTIPQTEELKRIR